MSAATWYRLTAFQRDLLRSLAALETADTASYGLAIKRDLEGRYEEEVNHGRLYPNLDDLVEAGFIAKGELDRRTNHYELTAQGRALLEAQRQQFEADLDTDADASRTTPRPQEVDSR